MVRDVFVKPTLADSNFAPEFCLSYWHIASLEQAIWGQTFHNPDPAPGRTCACDTCRFGQTLHLPPMNVDNYIRPIINITHQPWEDTENPKEME